MAEIQNELEIKIGTEEAITLKPMKVRIMEVKIEEVGEKKAKKVIASCKHPDAEIPIKISAVKWENKGKLEVSGLWFNRDTKNQIRKGSALATFLQSLNADMIGSIVGKEVNTIPDENNYLVFKGY